MFNNNSPFYSFDKTWLMDSCRNVVMIRKNNVCHVSFEHYTVSDPKSSHYNETVLKVHVTTNNSELNFRKYFDDLMSAEIAVQKIFGDDIEL